MFFLLLFFFLRVFVSGDGEFFFFLCFLPGFSGVAFSRVFVDVSRICFPRFS